jgi:hypothetical protein
VVLADPVSRAAFLHLPAVGEEVLRYVFLPLLPVTGCFGAIFVKILPENKKNVKIFFNHSNSI